MEENVNNRKRETKREREREIFSRKERSPAQRYLMSIIA